MISKILIQRLNEAQEVLPNTAHTEFLHAILEIFDAGDENRMREFYQAYHQWQLRSTKGDKSLALDCAQENIDL